MEFTHNIRSIGIRIYIKCIHVQMRLFHDEVYPCVRADTFPYKRIPIVYVNKTNKINESSLYVNIHRPDVGIHLT